MKFARQRLISSTGTRGRIGQLQVQQKDGGYIERVLVADAIHFFLRRAAVSNSLSTDPITVALDGGHVSMMKQTIEQGDNASGVGN